MSRRCYPLLEVKQALADAARAMADASFYVEVLMHEAEGHYPPGGDTFVQNLAAARRLVPYLVPPALADAIAKEQGDYDAAEAYHNRH